MSEQKELYEIFTQDRPTPTLFEKCKYLVLSLKHHTWDYYFNYDRYASMETARDYNQLWQKKIKC
jgi:hypothetical protein